jgi:hypothetical protein
MPVAGESNPTPSSAAKGGTGVSSSSVMYAGRDTRRRITAQRK